MNDLPAFHLALDRALTGAPEARAGFGLSRLVASDPLWEERLTIDGSGQIDLRSRRSIADVGGEAIGHFSFDAGLGAVQALLQTLRGLPLTDVPREHVEPFAVRVVVTVIIGGLTQEIVIGANPAAIEPLKPLLDLLDQFASAARRQPVKALALELAVGNIGPAGLSAVPVCLRFLNAGTTGYWLPEPTALPNPVDPIEARSDAGVDDDTAGAEESWDPDSDDADEDDEAALESRHDWLSLWCGIQSPMAPDVTPLPMVVSRVRLQAIDTQHQQFAWIAGQSSLERHFLADLRGLGSGSLVMRAGWSSYAGEDCVAGQARMRGAAFARDERIHLP